MVSADVSAGVGRPGELGLGDLVDQLGAGQRWLIEEADALDKLDLVDKVRAERLSRGIDKWVRVEAAAVDAGLVGCPIPTGCSPTAPIRCRFCAESSEGVNRPFQEQAPVVEAGQRALFLMPGQGGRH